MFDCARLSIIKMTNKYQLLSNSQIFGKLSKSHSLLVEDLIVCTYFFLIMKSYRAHRVTNRIFAEYDFANSVHARFVLFDLTYRCL